MAIPFCNGRNVLAYQKLVLFGILIVNEVPDTGSVPAPWFHGSTRSRGVWCPISYDRLRSKAGSRSACRSVHSAVQGSRCKGRVQCSRHTACHRSSDTDRKPDAPYYIRYRIPGRGRLSTGRKGKAVPRILRSWHFRCRNNRGR